METTSIPQFYENVRTHLSEGKFAIVASYLRSFEINRGITKTTETEYTLREFIIGEFVRILREDLANHREGKLVTELARFVPVIASNTEEQRRSEGTACRIAWELFIQQFPEHLRWAAHNDPFYSDTATMDLDDVEKISIQSSQAAAEKRYRGVIQMLRDACRKQREPMMNPLPVRTNHPSTEPSITSSLAAIASPQPTQSVSSSSTSAKSSLSSVRSSMIAPSFRSTRFATAPPAGEDSRGFNRRPSPSV